MLIKVYLPDGEVEELTVAPGSDPLDAIFAAFGIYAEYSILRRA